ncbi:MAG: hypothetical protein LUD39_04005 [Opitutae bacterium]|nr:hypothetical protein [Opitutae bacterium]
MKNDSDNGSPSDDSGGNPEIHCSEAEWRQILERGKSESARFLKLYRTIPLKGDEDRLDKCAVAMGWHLASADGEEDITAAQFDFDAPIPPPPPSPAVYSLHNTPEAIAVFALFKNISDLLFKLFPLVSTQSRLATTICAKTIKALDCAERDMLLAIDAMDALEYGLATILMKQAVAAINAHFSSFSAALSKISPTCRAEKTVGTATNSVKKIAAEIRASAFDLRELCLRVIRDADLESGRREDDAEE